MSQQDETLFTFSTADAQDILIICSAGFSLVKSLMAVGTYSYFHLVFAVIELICTSLAFAIFYTEDYSVAERREQLYGDDAMLYMLTFVSGILIEWMDVLFTYQTVRTYKRLKITRSRRVIEATKRDASTTYKCTFVFALVSSAIIPLIAFSKAGWETDYFAPTEFSSGNGRLLFISVVISIACQGIQAIFATLNAMNPEGLINVAQQLGKFLNFAVFSSAVLVYIVLARVSGPEAGALAYICMINTIQGVESMCEISRHLKWYELEHPLAAAPCGDPSATVSSVEDVLLEHFRQADIENTGYLPVADVLKKLQDLESIRVLDEGAATALLAIEQIDYRGTINTIIGADLVRVDEGGDVDIEA